MILNFVRLELVTFKKTDLKPDRLTYCYSYFLYTTISWILPLFFRLCLEYGASKQSKNTKKILILNKKIKIFENTGLTAFPNGPFHMLLLPPHS